MTVQNQISLYERLGGAPGIAAAVEDVWANHTKQSIGEGSLCEFRPGEGQASGPRTVRRRDRRSRDLYGTRYVERPQGPKHQRAGIPRGDRRRARRAVQTASEVKEQGGVRSLLHPQRHYSGLMRLLSRLFRRNVPHGPPGAGGALLPRYPPASPCWMRRSPPAFPGPPAAASAVAAPAVAAWNPVGINPTSDFAYVLEPQQIADGAALACQTRLKTNVVVRLKCRDLVSCHHNPRNFQGRRHEPIRRECSSTSGDPSGTLPCLSALMTKHGWNLPRRA